MVDIYHTFLIIPVMNCFRFVVEREQAFKMYLASCAIISPTLSFAKSCFLTEHAPIFVCVCLDGRLMLHAVALMLMKSHRKTSVAFSAGEPLFQIHFLGVSSKSLPSIEDFLFSDRTNLVALNFEWQDPLFQIHFVGVSSKSLPSIEDFLFSARTNLVALNFEWQDPLFQIHFLGVSSKSLPSIEDFLFSARTNLVTLNFEWQDLCHLLCALLK